MVCVWGGFSRNNLRKLGSLEKATDDSLKQHPKVILAAMEQLHQCMLLTRLISIFNAHIIFYLAGSSSKIDET